MVKNIGVSNYTKPHLEILLDHAEIKPVVNQIEIHPLCYDYDAIELCKQNDILVQAYSPFGRWHKDVVENELICRLAQEKKITVAQLILAFLTQKGFIVLPKTNNPERVLQNIQITEITFSESEIQQLDELGK